MGDASRLMLALSVALLFLSQFYYYIDDIDIGLYPMNRGLAGPVYYSYTNRATGWELHPHAYVIIAVLAIAIFRDDVAGHPWFRVLGYWASAALVFGATIPGAYFRAFGAAMGGIAVFLAVAAAVVNHTMSRHRR